MEKKTYAVELGGAAGRRGEDPNEAASKDRNPTSCIYIYLLKT